jgi:hypothetical protein
VRATLDGALTLEQVPYLGAGKAGLLPGWWISSLVIMEASPGRRRIGRTKHSSGAYEGVSSTRDG